MGCDCYSICCYGWSSFGVMVHSNSSMVNIGGERLDYVDILIRDVNAWFTLVVRIGD